MTTRKLSAHAQLDQLRQAAAAERVNERELAARLEAAKAAVDDAGAAVTEAYAADDAKLATRRRQELDAAAAEVLDLQHRFDAAGLRIRRAQAEADTFQAEHSRKLLDEREPAARQSAEQLTHAGLEVVRLHRAYRDMRTEIDTLVAAVPGATSRADGPAPSHRGRTTCAPSSAPSNIQLLPGGRLVWCAGPGRRGERCERHRNPTAKGWSGTRDRSAQRRLRTALLKRARNRCEWVDRRGVRCAVTVDLRACHLTPVSLGGGYDPADAVLLCREHDMATDRYAR